MTTKYPFKPVDEQLAYLRKGAAEIIPEPELKAKLEKSEDDLQTYADKNGLLFLETDKGTTENIVTQRLR